MTDAYDVLGALPVEVKEKVSPAVRVYLLENAPPVGSDAEFRAGWWMAQTAMALTEIERQAKEGSNG